MKKGQIKFKYELVDVFEDYCWIVGLSLIIGGLFLIVNDAKVLFGAGILIASIGAYFKGRKKLK